MTCRRCHGDRVVDGRCLDCWQASDDWQERHLRPVTERIEYDEKQANAVRIICAACGKPVDATDHTTTVCFACREARWRGSQDEDDEAACRRPGADAPQRD